MEKNVEIKARYRHPSGAVYYIDGGWHDASGVAITLSDRDEADLMHDMSTMESVNYSSMPDYIMLDGYDNVEAMAEDYLGCDPDDAFVYFASTDPADSAVQKNNAENSPVSQRADYADSMYILASLNTLGEIMYFEIPVVGRELAVELADLNGHLSFRTMKAFDVLMKWALRRGAVAIYCDARESTSNKLLSPRMARKIFAKYGYADVSNISLDEDELMVPRLLILKSWFDGLDPASKAVLKRYINRRYR